MCKAACQFVLPQDLQNAAHMGDVFRERFREDDDVTEDPHRDGTRYSLRISFMKCWNMAGAFVGP